MAVATEEFTAWLQQADIPAQRLTPALNALLHAVFRFRHAQGCDYYSTRLLSHFLLHADSSLKVAQIARLLGISRPNASKQQKLSSKQVIQQAHHRLDGRPYGKLLPRYAGAIAAFLLGQPNASRAELIDFVERTFGVRVSRVALHKYLKKYGLAASATTGPTPAQANGEGKGAPTASANLPISNQPAPSVEPPPGVASAPVPLSAFAVDATLIEVASTPAPGRPSALPFCSDGRNTPVPSC
jgi:hypothetical protein